MGRYTAYIGNGVFGDTTAQSSFGLPGQNLPPVYCRCDITVQINVDDSGTVTVGVFSGTATQSNVVGDDFPCELYADYNSFIAQPHWNNHIIASGPGYNNSGTFLWSLSDNGYPVNMGNVANLQRWPGSDIDGTIYVAGIATYAVTDPVYPQAVALRVPGIMVELDYFPGARSITDWQSHNRIGGHAQRMKSAWTNIKNNPANPASQPENQGMRFVSTNWKAIDKMGNGAQ